MLQNNDEITKKHFLSDRMRLIERLIANQDQDAMSQVLQEDRENILYLQSELRRLGDSITNIYKVQQYAWALDGIA